MRVILNNRPLLFTKTGVGYYVYNLYHHLLLSPDIEISTTIDVPSSRVISAMSKGAQHVRRVLGDGLLKITVPIGDLLVSSRMKDHGHLPPADIYHETFYEAIPPVARKTVANIYDLSFLLVPHLLPDRIVRDCRASLGDIVNAHRIIVNSRAVRDEVVSLLRVPEDRIAVIPLAPAAGYGPVQDQDSIRKTARRFVDGDYLLFVGTVEPRKNLAVLLRAFRVLRERRDVKLVIAGGKGWMYADILKMPRELGIERDIAFAGYVNEKTMLHLYNGAIAVVYPSLYEGFGLPVVEAMACGRPLVVSDIPPLREVAGEAALYVRPDDDAGLADALSRVLNSDSLRRSLGEQGLVRSREYSWDRVAALTIEAYRTALAS